MDDVGTAFDKYLRTANYLTAAQIFLQDNFLLERPLSFDDIKPRLLGRWGSGPGVNFAYSHLSHPAKVYVIPSDEYGAVARHAAVLA